MIDLPRAVLKGLQVLIVEDDFLVAQSLAAALDRLGCAVLGPCSTSEQACRIADETVPDIAILDVVVDGGNTESIARKLVKAGRPFFFLTGFRSVEMLPPDLRDQPRLQKPVDLQTLGDEIVKLVHRP